MALLFALLPGLWAVPAWSTSVAQVATENLVTQAQLIFQGEVYARSVERAPGGAIHTWVEFRVDEVIKGEWSGNAIRLRFAGGALGDEAQDYGALIPAPGEQGIYFVESLRRHQFNPLLGWTQGHFTITSENLVLAADGRAVIGVDYVQAPRQVSISSGVAEGFVTRAPGDWVGPVERPLTPGEFRARIRALAARAADRGNAP